MNHRFELIKGTASLNGTCYFEFCAGSNRKQTCWNENAFYLEMEVFFFLCRVFVKADKNYDSYSFCKFEQPQLERMKEQLIDFEGTVGSFQKVEDYEDFFARLVKYPAYQEENKVMWEKQSAELRQVAKQLLNLAEKCIRNQEVLWVLGI